MNFDYTYITIFGVIVFEPVTIFTNILVALFCLYSYLKINLFKFKLANQWAWFFLLIGVSSLIGSAAHGAHFQLGKFFFKTTLFLMNAVSLIAIYFCFKAANTYSTINKPNASRYATYFVIFWILILLVFTFIKNDFLLIKIHAGIVLVYSLTVHYLTYRKNQKGSGFITAGILISFLSIIVHSMKFSFSDWFNYKDIAHVIMLLSLYFIYQGIKIKLRNNGPVTVTAETVVNS